MNEHEVETVHYPSIRVRRSISERVDEVWEILLADGEPNTVDMHVIIYTPGGEAVTKSEAVGFEPRDVPAEVVSEVETHLVPKGAFTR